MCSVALLDAADLSSSYTWKPIRIGGGGFVTGVVVHPAVDNVVYCRTDVGGAYRWDASTGTWTQLIVSSRMPAEILGIGEGNPGVRRTNAYQIESIALDPSDASVVYVAAGDSDTDQGFLLKSTNGGASFQRTGLTVPMRGNGEYRTGGERLAIHPGNSNIVLFGSRTAGLWRSTDAGATWAQIPTSQLPAGVDIDGHKVGVISVAFDPSTPSRVYASVAGVGIYRSDDAGSSWFSILGNGLWATELEVSQGVLYATGQKAQIGVRRYTPAGGWTTVTPNGDTSTDEIAVDRNNSNRIFAASGDGFRRFYRSTNGGASWTELGTNHGSGKGNFRSSSIPWVEASTVRDWLSVGALTLDPRQPSRLWFAEGMGMWRSIDATDTNNAPVFHNISQGIEEMVANDIVALPNGSVITATWDRIGFVHTNLDSYPSAQLGLSQAFSSGWSLATTRADSGYVAAVVSDHRGCCGDGVYAGFSSDSGASWTRFSANSGGANNPQSLRFGELVVSATNTQNLVWLPRSGSNTVHHSTNGGASWQASGVSYNDWSAPFFGSRRRLAADGATGGRFYLYRWTDGVLLRSTDGGASFSDAGGRLPSYTYWSQLKAVPGQSGHLWFATGYDQSGSGRGLYRSTDAGASFTQVAGVSDAWAVGFGRSVTDGGYPTVFIFGVVEGQWGVFRSTNQGLSWDRLAEFPLGIFDKVTVITGDPSVFGRVYIGWSGNSFAYGTPATSVPAAPTGLSATAVSTSRIDLSWTDNATDETVYRVEMATASGGPFNEIQGSLPANTRSFSVTGLNAATTYWFRVRAGNATGNSSYSNTASATTQAASGGGGSGSITREVWNNIGGNSVARIPVGSPPSSTGTLGSFEAPTNVADSYGQRIRGYLTPTQSGNYTFWIAGDDNVELWLSSNDSPANRVRIAHHNGWTRPREWGKYSSQRSSPIALTAGARYYIEALMKEDSGGDNLAVAWRLNDSTTPANGDASLIIPGSVLSPFGSASGGSDTSVFNFENGTQGWVVGWGSIMTGVQASAERAFLGSQSLRITFNKTGTSVQDGAVRVLDHNGAAGRTVTFRFWIPTGAPITRVYAFAQTGGNWSWTENNATGVVQGQWNTVTLNVPNSLPIQGLGLAFSLNQSFSGHVFVDSVTY